MVKRIITEQYTMAVQVSTDGCRCHRISYFNLFLAHSRPALQAQLMPTGSRNRRRRLSYKHQSIVVGPARVFKGKLAAFRPAHRCSPVLCNLVRITSNQEISCVDYWLLGHQHHSPKEVCVRKSSRHKISGSFHSEIGSTIKH
jgi:hypothetical protein